MNINFIVGGAVGYVLGTKAGHERYEQIVSLARRIMGSQTVQSAAGVIGGQLDSLGQHAKQLVGAKAGGLPHGPSANGTGN
jgi:hypothetical protein